jgi:hypothetical protein
MVEAEERDATKKRLSRPQRFSLVTFACATRWARPPVTGIGPGATWEPTLATRSPSGRISVIPNCRDRSIPPTAFMVAASAPGCSLASCSARPCQTTRSSRPSSRRRVIRKEARLRRDSTRVSRSLGSTIRRGTPGNPAPEPTSITARRPGGRNARNRSDSMKRFLTIARGSFSPTRSCTRFHSINNIRYLLNRWSSSGDSLRPSADAASSGRSARSLFRIHHIPTCNDTNRPVIFMNRGYRQPQALGTRHLRPAGLQSSNNQAFLAALAGTRAGWAPRSM